MGVGPSVVTACVGCIGYNGGTVGGFHFGAAGAPAGWVGWGTMALGLAGWLLLAAGVGKLLAWPTFAAAMAEDQFVPSVLRRPFALLLPVLEVLGGALVLFTPSRSLLIAVALLLTVIAAYESERLWRGAPDSLKFGRLRRVHLSPAVVVVDAVLAGGLLATATGWAPGLLHERLITGFVMCAMYVGVVGLWRWRPGAERTASAETAYLREHLMGRTDDEARARVAQELRIPVDHTYLLLPPLDAWWLRVRNPRRPAASGPMTEQPASR